MDLMIEDLTLYWYIWLLAALLIGLVAFAAGANAVFHKKNTIKCLMPMLGVEFLILALSGMKVKRWMERGVSFWWVIYEHGPEVYLVVIAFATVLIGYPVGMAFARREKSMKV